MNVMISRRLNSVAARVVAWILAVTVAVLSIVPPELRPETGVPHYFEHFLIYAAMAAAFGLGYERSANALATILVAFCGLIEILQLFVPGRHARLLDFAIDAVATCFGVAVASFLKMLYRRTTHGI
jgi:VanZ family protein